MPSTISALAKGLHRSKPYIRKLLKNGSGNGELPPLWEHVNTSERTFIVDDYAVQALSDFVIKHPIGDEKISMDGEDSSPAVPFDRATEIRLLQDEIGRLKASLDRANRELERADREVTEKSGEIERLKGELREERSMNARLQDEKLEQADMMARLRGELLGVERAGLFRRIRGFSFAGLLTDGR